MTNPDPFSNFSISIRAVQKQLQSAGLSVRQSKRLITAARRRAESRYRRVPAEKGCIAWHIFRKAGIDAVANLLKVYFYTVDIHTGSGVYFLFAGDSIVYIGQSRNCFVRIAKHIQDGEKMFDSVRVLPLNSGESLDQNEAAFISFFSPQYNLQRGAKLHAGARLPIISKAFERMLLAYFEKPRTHMGVRCYVPTGGGMLLEATNGGSAARATLSEGYFSDRT